MRERQGTFLNYCITWLWKSEFASLFRILEKGVRDFGYLHFVSVVSVSCAWKISSSFSVLQAEADWGSSILLKYKKMTFLSFQQ